MGIRKPLLSVVETKRLAKIWPSVPVDDPGLEVATMTPADPDPTASVAEMPTCAKAMVTTENRSPPRRNATALTNERPPLPSQFAPRSAGRIQVFLSAIVPSQGASRVFDQLCREYNPGKALQMILRRALDDYEGLLENGAFQKTATSYVSLEDNSAKSIVQTSRMMPVNLLAIARAHFDPLGLESARTFGRKLATAALAAFFDDER